MNIIVRTGVVLAGCAALAAGGAGGGQEGKETPPAWTRMGPQALTEEFLKLASWGTVKELECRRLARYAR
ncbi:MAG: hypothetical protein NTV86_10255 [Planctomycetota bacterium]|nr:hypothetical protein [Planctomycetota bacterium]